MMADDDHQLDTLFETNHNVTTSNVCDDNVEERFRVDRRKLEQLIQAVNQNESHSAEEFFLKIMKQTNTIIAWPSKLKIGAKSKKDPHIKVTGTKEAVTAAKEKILNILNTNTSPRVTLKMEVAHSEHSHVIGKGGNNIKRVMHETGCHVHFPDSNRNSAAEKSNQVSISGVSCGVEDARHRIRELQPLVFMFDLPSFPVSTTVYEGSRVAIIQQVQQTHRVTVSIRPHQRSIQASVVIVRGSVGDYKAVKEATTVLFEQLTGSIGPVTVKIAVSISPHHHAVMIGQGGLTLQQMMQRTGATIQFPNLSITDSQQRGTVYISGTMAGVCAARHLLLGCVPLVLIFDLDEETGVSQGELSQLMDQFSVFISIKPKPKQPTNTVIIKSMERNMANIYAAWRQLTGANGNVASVPSFNTFFPLSSVMPVYTRPVYPRPVVLQPTLPTYVCPSAAAATAASDVVACTPSSTVLGSPVPTVLWSPRSTNVVTMLTQAHGLLNSSGSQSGSELTVASNHATTLMNRSTMFSDRCHDHRHPTVQPHWKPPASVSSGSQQRVDCVSQTPLEDVASQLVANLPVDIVKLLLERDSSQQTVEMPAETLHALKSHNVDLFNIDAVQKLSSNPQFTDIVKELFHCSVFEADMMKQAVGRWKSFSGLLQQTENNDAAFSSPQEYSQLELDGAGCQGVMRSLGQLGQAPPHQLEAETSNLYCAASVSSPLACAAVNLSKAPGSNRPNKSISSLAFANADCWSSSDFDYDYMKLMANRAIHTKPGGESRVPTDLWAGCGFSRSMPDADLRLKLSHNAYRRHVDTIPFETADTELNSDVWSNSLTSSGGLQAAGSLDTLSCMSSQSAESPPLSLAKFARCSSLTSHASDVLQPATTVCTSLTEVPTAPASSSCYDNGAVGGVGVAVTGGTVVSNVTSRDLWCPDGRPSMADTWSSSNDLEDLAELFSRIGLGKYTDIFQKQEIDLATFLTLSDQDLKDLGISTFGARRKMLTAIADINKQQTLLLPQLPTCFYDAGSSPAVRRHDLASQSGHW